MLGALGAAAALGPTAASAQTYALERVPSIGPLGWARAQLVLEPGLTWLDTASFGPTLRAVLVRGYRQLEEQSLDFREFETLHGPGSAGERTVLAESARFFGCDAGELAFTDGARTGLALVAAGLDLQAGRRSAGHAARPSGRRVSVGRAGTPARRSQSSRCPRRAARSRPRTSCSGSAPRSRRARV